MTPLPANPKSAIGAAAAGPDPPRPSPELFEVVFVDLYDCEHLSFLNPDAVLDHQLG